MLSMTRIANRRSPKFMLASALIAVAVGVPSVMGVFHRLNSHTASSPAASVDVFQSVSNDQLEELQGVRPTLVTGETPAVSQEDAEAVVKARGTPRPPTSSA